MVHNYKNIFNKHIGQKITYLIHINRLSSDAISSAYDDRLDKNGPGAPGGVKSPTPGTGSSRNR